MTESQFYTRWHTFEAGERASQIPCLRCDARRPTVHRLPFHLRRCSLSSHRRTVLKQGLSLFGTAAAVAASGGTVLAADRAASDPAPSSTRLVLHGVGWRVSSR